MDRSLHIFLQCQRLTKESERQICNHEITTGTHSYILIHHHLSTHTLKISSLHFNADFQCNKGYTAQGDYVKYKSIIH